MKNKTSFPIVHGFAGYEIRITPTLFAKIIKEVMDRLLKKSPASLDESISQIALSQQQLINDSKSNNRD